MDHQQEMAYGASNGYVIEIQDGGGLHSLGTLTEPLNLIHAESLNFCIVPSTGHICYRHRH